MSSSASTTAQRKPPHPRGNRVRRLVFTVRVKEPFAALSHLAGVFFGISALIFLVTYSALYETQWHVVSFAVYGACMILMYGASTAYHWLPMKPSQEKLLRRIDHSMIYLMIAGSYTPIALVGLRDTWGWPMLAIIWSLAIYGVSQHVRHHRNRKPFNHRRWTHTVLYLIMGWISAAFLWQIARVYSVQSLGWLFGGGLAYTVGAAIYGIKRPNPWPGVFGFHDIFHLCVLLGSLCHFWFMVAHVLPHLG